MNKLSSILYVFILITLFSCSKTPQRENIITVTIEPQRYFAEQLTDTLYNIISMVPPGVSPETYDPTPNQMAQLAHSKAYFCIGHIGFEEVWMEKLKKNNPEVKFFDNSEGIQFISSHEEHDHGHNHNHDGHHHSHSGIDPHIWSSPKEALTIVQNMHNALVEIDPENQSFYLSRLNQLKAEMTEIDKTITAILNNSPQKAFIIYHPALTYFARDYGLSQYCIEIEGKEPSPEQLKSLIETAREHNIRTIFIQEEFDKKNAEIVAKETGCQLIVINPLSYNWGEEMIRIAKALSNE